MYKYQMEEYMGKFPQRMNLLYIYIYIFVCLILNLILFFAFKNIIASIIFSVFFVIIFAISLKKSSKVADYKNFYTISTVINGYVFFILTTIVVLWQMKLNVPTWLFVLESLSEHKGTVLLC